MNFSPIWTMCSLQIKHTTGDDGNKADNLQLRYLKKKKKQGIEKKKSTFDEIIASAVIFCYCFRNVLSLSLSGPYSEVPCCCADERSSLFKISCRALHNIEALKAHGKFNILLHLMEAEKNYMQNILYIHCLKTLWSYSFPYFVNQYGLISIFKNTKEAHGVSIVAKIRMKLKPHKVRLGSWDV